MKTHANRENDKQRRKERGSSTCNMHGLLKIEIGGKMHARHTKIRA